MPETEKSSSRTIKIISLVLLLFVESFFLTRNIINYVQAQQFFTADFKFIGISTILILAILVTNALMAGAWNTWEQYVLTPLPVTAGIFINIFPINSAYAVIIGFFVIILLSYDILLASHLKEQMLIFNPRLILKFSSKGLYMAFSITATFLVLITAGKEPEINLGEKVGTFVEANFAPQINKQLEEQMQEGLTPMQLERLAALGLDTSQFKAVPPSTFFDSVSDSLPSIPTQKLSIKNTVEREVNKIVEPYKKFVNPLMAVIMFGLMQFIGVIAMLIFMLVIDVIFWSAKKTGFLKTSTETVEKEILHF